MTKRSACFWMAALVILDVVFLAGFLQGCSSGNYDELIDEYNENFTVTYNDAQNHDVDELSSGVCDWLLRDLYTVENRATRLTIVGPSNCKSYEWNVYPGQAATGSPVSGLASLTGSSFSVYIPETSLMAATWYCITISVTTNSDAVLTDTGKIWINGN
ncbi:MAG: hypothetical protein K6G00_06145 [Treponema sp.]|nr:hypothetical protein [Treponema sp.]